MRKSQIIMQFAKNLAEARMQAGITRVELSEHSGLDHAAIYRYEYGEMEPKLTSIVALCQALECSADNLLGLE